MTAQEFDKSIIQDFENGAVTEEIYNTLRKQEDRIKQLEDGINSAILKLRGKEKGFSRIDSLDRISLSYHAKLAVKDLQKALEDK